MGRVDSEAIANNGGQQQPLLSSTHETDGSYDSEKKGVFLIWGRWVLEISIWVIFISWITLMFLLALDWYNEPYKSWIKRGGGTLYGITGRVLLVYSSPIVMVGILAYARFIILDSLGEEDSIPFGKRPSLRLSTLPVMVNGIFGVVSAAEVIGLIIVAIFVIWYFIEYLFKNIELTGVMFGYLGSFTLVFLFLTVTRGSPILRLMNIPFERAVKYHIWLGNLAMILFTLHGISIVFITTSIDGFSAIFLWANDNVASLAGIITLSIGWVIWITSIPPIRRKYFETFYYTHHLYILFLLFFALHAGSFFFAMVSGTVFIFIIDRILRLWQSQRVVDVVSTKYHPCGVVELALAKPTNLRYNAMSFIFLRIREVSWLQWHPFSISSTPLDGEDHLSIMIKVQGEWTTKLKDQVLSILSNGQGDKLTASVEGPYGYELPYYITYSNLVLVAGGVGISPFLAILNDILCRTREGKPCLAKNILMVWAVKKSNELPLLSKVNITESISSFFADRLINIETRIYVTQERGPQLEEGDNYVPGCNLRDYFASARTISTLVGTGNSKWLAIYLLSCAIGFVILKALFDILFVIPLGERFWSFKGFLLLASMVVAVVVFGGPVLGLWHLREAKRVVSGECENGNGVRVERPREGHLIIENNTSIEYGSRPDFGAIFEDVNKSWGLVDVGVIVCGPSSLESSVAKQCRSFNFRRNSKCNQPIFHFHSHSFSF